jgi:hypothetical protein
MRWPRSMPAAESASGHRHRSSSMNNRLLFLTLLLLLLAYTLLERVLREQLDHVPAALDFAGVALAVGSLPWSLAALAFFRATEDPVTHILRDLFYLLILTGGVALNIVLLKAALAWIIRQWRGS